MRLLSEDSAIQAPGGASFNTMLRSSGVPRGSRRTGFFPRILIPLICDWMLDIELSQVPIGLLPRKVQKKRGEGSVALPPENQHEPHPFPQGAARQSQKSRE